MANSEDVFDVVIVGAGLAGLSAAWKLKERKIAVLEARDRVGGRTKTSYTEKTNAMVDVGGAYVGPGQDFVLNLAKEFGMSTYKVFTKGRDAFEHPETGRITSKLLPMSIWELMDLNSLLLRIEKLGNDVERLEREKDILDNMSMGDWVKKYARTKVSSAMAELVSASNLCKPINEISMYFVLTQIRMVGGFAHALEAEGGAQDSKFVEGAAELSERLRAALPEGSVHFKHVVSTIDQESDLVKITCKNGNVFSARQAIITIPLPIYETIEWKPSLPSEKLELVKVMEMGSCIKVNVFYEKAFWREKGLSAVIVATVAEAGPIATTYDDCRPDGSNSSIIGFIGGENAKKWSAKPQKERQAAVIDQLVRFFGEEAREVVDYIDEDWTREEFSRGCYSCTPPPGGHWKSREEILGDKVDKVHFAGTETAWINPGYMDGAIESGFRAAHEILNPSEPYEKPPLHVASIPLIQQGLAATFDFFFPPKPRN